MNSQRLSLWRYIALMMAIVAIVGWALAASTAAAKRDLKFSHGQHVDENGMECAKCHTAAPTSTTGADDLLPGHDACKECHDVAKTDECNKCHTSATPKLSARITDYNKKFDHKRHIENGKLACKDCHANLDKPLHGEQVGHLPRMATCVECHRAKSVKTECAVCHLPTDNLKPFSHKLDWTTRHGGMASSEEECNLCHKTDDCQKCHNGDPVLNPHPRDYISRHGPEAHLSDLSCSTCHEQRSFCVSCHRSMNILPIGHSHANWAVPGTGGEHRDQAASDLESCMSCHDTPNQEPICSRCHQK